MIKFKFFFKKVFGIVSGILLLCVILCAISRGCNKEQEEQLNTQRISQNANDQNRIAYRNESGNVYIDLHSSSYSNTNQHYTRDSSRAFQVTRDFNRAVNQNESTSNHYNNFNMPRSNPIRPQIRQVSNDLPSYEPNPRASNISSINVKPYPNRQMSTDLPTYDQIMNKSGIH